MTKSIRVENACNSDYMVKVEVWEKGYPEGQPDKLVETIPLNLPTSMTPPSLYITNTRYLVVRENGVRPKQ